MIQTRNIPQISPGLIDRSKFWLAKIPRSIVYILTLFLLTRVALAITGVLARTVFHRTLPRSFSDNAWLDIWGVWDSGNYVDISGMWYPTDMASSYIGLYAFFPFYPLLMKLLGMVTCNTYLAGLIISNVCLLISCIYLYRLVKLDHDEDTALRSVTYLFLFPCAFILSGVFTEGIFLTLLIACFYYARKSNWLYVGLLGFCLALTRSIGILTLLPMICIYYGWLTLDMKAILRGPKQLLRTVLERTRPDLAFLLLIPAGLGFLMAYDYYLTGDALMFMHIQRLWGGELSNPLAVLAGRLLSVGNLSPGNLPYLFGAFFTLATLAALLVFYKRIGLPYLLFGLYAIMVPLSGGIATGLSMPRFILIIFPLFILAAELLKDRRLYWLSILLLVPFQLFLMAFWTNWTFLIL